MSLTATELLAAYAAGDLSPVEITHAALRRIEKHNETYNAFCFVDHEAALAQADESEQRWAQGQPAGLLDGVPASIKDVFLTKGMPTLRGSTSSDPHQDWDIDAPVSARLREHGTVLLGKVTTPELGWKAVTDSPLNGITRNPHDPRLTAGGSSGGSGVAVALDMGPVSVGTDGGGSIRIPAAFCGIFGFKPTYGRIPLFPASPYGGLAHAGPMTNSVDDAALLLDVLALSDLRDPTALPPHIGSYREVIRRSISGVTAAFSPTLGYVEVDAEVATIVRDAVDALADAGLTVELKDPGFSDPVDTFHTLWSCGAAKGVAGFPHDALDKLDPGLRTLQERGATFSATDYLTAEAERIALGRHLGEFHQTYDVLITPTVPIPAFEAGHDVPPSSAFTDWPRWTPFTYPFNLTQQPAASVPVGKTSEGLPVGLQVVGPRHSDDLVLAVCRALEKVRPWR